MQKVNKILLVLFAMSIYSCQTYFFSSDFSQKWIKDSKGCLSIRKEMAEKIWNKKQSVIGYLEEDIIKSLGYPDVINQTDTITYFIYFVEGGPQCFAEPSDSDASVIIFKFISNKLSDVEISTP
jgi:hypothetical protein